MQDAERSGEPQDVIQGRPADPFDVFLLDWGRETYKQIIPRLNDALQRIITLSAALLGGSIYFVNAESIPAGFRAVAMLAFFGALTAAFIGTHFRRETVDLNDPHAIERFKLAVIGWRDRCLSWASALLWIGLGCAAAGVVSRWLA